MPQARHQQIAAPYVWKNEYPGMVALQLRYLKDIGARLKRMYADLALEHHRAEERPVAKKLS